MPRKPNRPTQLPDDVQNRAKSRVPSTARRAAPPMPATPEPLTETAAVLVSDPAASAPESPTRPMPPSRAIVHSPIPEPEPEPIAAVNQVADEGAIAPWWEQQLLPTHPPAHSPTHSPTQPDQARGRVGIKVQGDRLRLAAEGSDVVVDFDPQSLLPLPSSPVEGGGNVESFRLLLTGLVCITCLGVFALVAFFVSRPRVIVVPSPEVPSHVQN